MGDTGMIEKILAEPADPASSPTGKLRVCAYARVSTETEEQKTSFDSQVRAYTDMIQANPKYEFAGVYADYALTGTSADRRPAFQQMIQACECGEIDLILTKSISRFARNTIDCLTYVRRLNNMGVHIIFESNHIDTRVAFSEMLLTVLSAFAQEESRSISENTIWGIRKRFESGVARWCRIYGYEKTEAGEYQIVPEQARVVQLIFTLYEHGSTIQAIREHLAEQQIPSPNGESRWSRSTVQTMLTNEKYMGDILLQKFCTENHLSHKAVKNDQTEVPSYYIKNHHAAIISRAQFSRVQKIRALRRMNGVKGACIQYPLGDKLRCPYCGSVLYQRSIPVQARRTSGWRCETGETACHGFIIRSRCVEQGLLSAYNELSPESVRAQAETSRFRTAAEIMLNIKQAHPKMERVDYWWVDELIDHITFGAHTCTQRELAQAAALGQPVADDRTMTIIWKCGLVSTVHSGVHTDRDDPRHVAKLFSSWLERQGAQETEGAETA